MPYFKIENLSKSYNKNIIFKDVNISLEKGEVCTILGRSGSGKTTLFNILAGFEKPDTGNIFLENKALKHNEFSPHISYMQQKHLLLKHLTVFDNIALPMRIKKIHSSEINIKVSQVLKQFGLWQIKDKFPSQISGGMQQRVSFMRAYLKSKDLILLDEPFSALDNITKFEIYNWFIDIIKNEKSTILLITHDIQEAIIMANKVYIMDNSLDLDKKIIPVENKHLNARDFLNSNDFYKYYNKVLAYFYKQGGNNESC